MESTILSYYTDGGSHGNPGPGAWAWYCESGSSNDRKAGYESYTTNNRMELQAVISALENARPLNPSQVFIHTDSQYVKNGITTWIKSWKKNGWKTAAKKPVKNQDLWTTLDTLNQAMAVSWNWVRGHAGVKGNEICDQLVQEEIARHS